MRPLAALAIWFLAAGILGAGEKKLMHCFAFTPIETATDAEWQAFFKATDELPKKIPGLTRVWHGKLRTPLTVYSVSPDASKQFSDTNQKATGEVTRRRRAHGVCMEMNDEAALKTYAAHPAHAEWVEVYSKVRQPGTTTFDILGQ
ncbi:MAG: hypothetical protein FJW37_15230 [Acidobacteria bacterium]|nr:hypothetical protein [Acidobacteriota bacterium]